MTFAFFLKFISKEALLSGITRIFTLKCQGDEQNQVINAEHLAKSVTRQVNVNVSINSYCECYEQKVSIRTMIISV